MISSLALFLGDRENDRFTIMIVLLGLLASTQITRLALSAISPKFFQQPEYRQQEILVAIPITLLKVAIACLLAETDLECFNINRIAKSREELDYQLNIFFFWPLGYVFELLVLPLSLKNAIHHICVILAMCLFCWRRHTNSPPSMLELYQIPATIAIYGMGPLNNAIRFIYYGVFPNEGTIPIFVARGLGRLAWIGFAFQWTLVVSQIFSNFGPLKVALGSFERVVYPMMLLYWAWMQSLAVARSNKLAYGLSNTKKQKWRL
ncbi:hypothetical protein V8E51_013048 [Hyaloscypha variabilis]